MSVARRVTASPWWPRVERPSQVAQQIAGALALSVLGGLAVAMSGDPVLLIGLLAGVSLVALGLLRPALFLALLLLIRPLLDDFGGNSLGDVQSANAAGALGVVLIGVLAVVGAASRRFAAPRATLAFAGVLALSVLSAGIAFSGIDEMSFAPLSELVRLAALAAVYLLASHMVTSARALRTIFVVVALSAVAPALYGV